MATSFQAGGVCNLWTDETAAFRFEKLLGTGAFGEVWAVKNRATDETIALKTVHGQDVETARLEGIKHLRAVQMAGREYVPELRFCEEMVLQPERPGADAQHFLGLGMQLIDGRSLAALLRRQKGGVLRRGEAYVIVRDLFTALARLHLHGIVHCDVKSDNLLVNRKGGCYLCDFGVATFLQDYPDDKQAMPMVGTPSHMAPELVRTTPVRFDDKLDVWSAGILCFEMAVGRTPWHDEEDGHLPAEGYIFDMLKEIRGVDVSMVPFQGPYSRMLEDCFQVDPEERIRAKDLFQDPQFQRITEGQREDLGELL